MKERIYEIIEVDRDDDKWSSVYDIFMIGVIILSVIPMMLKNPGEIWQYTDRFCASIFIVDYALRLWTADLKLKDSPHPFLVYPFTPLAIIDLVSILPSITRLNNALKALRLVRIMRLMKVFMAFRIFKTLRYSKNFEIIIKVIKESWDALVAVILFAVAYIFVSALVVFNVEPQTFKNFFDALYWATISLTTVGYGDIYPVTEIGKLVTMISAILGLAIIALPSGIIMAGFMEELMISKGEASGETGQDGAASKSPAADAAAAKSMMIEGQLAQASNETPDLAADEEYRERKLRIKEERKQRKAKKSIKKNPFPPGSKFGH